jgi:GNAT superfamily N-acetyltransferase
LASKPARRRSAKHAVISGRAADYAAIHHFLTAVFQRPSQEEFRVSFEDPFHEPNDRLLVKDGARIVGHAHVTHRVMQFGSLELPVAGLHDLGVLPDFRGRGHGRRLLAAAERHMTDQGALLGLIWTRVPHFFRQSGWALCCRHCRSGATARSVLAGLESLGVHRQRRRLNIRLWRRMELAALVRTYAQNLPGSYGLFHRTAAYWQWLIARNAFDQIYVALDGPDLLELEESSSPIVGYAITRGDKIIELFTAPGRSRVAAELVARTCADAIERDHQTVVLHARPGSPLDKLFRRAGGRRADCSACACGVLMARLLDPVRFLDALSGRMRRRAEAARLALPAGLGLLVEGKKYQIELDRGGAGVSQGHLGRSYLRMNVADFTRLALGRLDFERAVAESRVVASTALAAKTAQTIFRRHSFWRPPLDEISV